VVTTGLDGRRDGGSRGLVDYRRIVVLALGACVAFAWCLASAAAATAASWRVVPSPGNGALSAVSCISTKVCTAVGFQGVNRGAAVPLAERWNGRTWSIQRTPKPAGSTFSALIGVSCTSRTFCIALGSFKGGFTTFVERWNGSRWSIQRIPKGFRATGVSCTSKTACIAVGGGAYTDGLGQFFGGGSSVGRWNGSRWSLQRRSPSGLSDVSCASATACVAVGSGAARWNGTKWSVQRTPNPGFGLGDWLWGVSCSSATACTAVGAANIDSSLDTVPVVDRLHGTRWSMQGTPNLGAPTSQFNHVSCASTNACVAVGSQGFGPPGQSTLAEGWNGSRWAIQRTDNLFGTSGPSELNGVSCTSRRACTAVGSFTNSASTTVTLVERYS
jgi:hypothetical protein